jgi:hypothetical protein
MFLILLRCTRARSKCTENRDGRSKPYAIVMTYVNRRRNPKKLYRIVTIAIICDVDFNRNCISRSRSVMVTTQRSYFSMANFQSADLFQGESLRHSGVSYTHFKIMFIHRPRVCVWYVYIIIYVNVPAECTRVLRLMSVGPGSAPRRVLHDIHNLM